MKRIWLSAVALWVLRLAFGFRPTTGDLRPATFFLSLLFTLHSSPALAQSQATFYAQAGQTVTIQAILELPSDFALQKRSQFWLSSPFGETLEIAASGKDWALEPEHYLRALAPLTWKIQVPVGAKSGKYRLEFRATVLACNKSIGVCQKHLITVWGQLVIGQNGRNTPVYLRFDPEKPFGS